MWKKATNRYKRSNFENKKSDLTGIRKSVNVQSSKQEEIIKWKLTILRLEKNKFYVSKLQHTFVFRCTFILAKFKLFIFFC